MAAIRSTDTAPELVIRKGLHSEGFRFRLHYKELPRRPDIVLPKYNAVILVNGCFWHMHQCSMFKWPRSNTEFWRDKLEKNAERDLRNLSLLRDLGWRTCIIWECALKGKTKLSTKEVISQTSSWLRGSRFHFCLEGSVHETVDTLT